MMIVINGAPIEVELTDTRHGETRYFTQGFTVARDNIDPGYFVWGQWAGASANVRKKVAWPHGPQRRIPKVSRFVTQGFTRKADAAAVMRWLEENALGPMTISRDGTVKQNPLGNLPNLRKRYAAVILTLSDLRAEKRKRGFDPGMAGYTVPEISDLIARFQVKASDLRDAINHYGANMNSNPLARIKTPGQKSQLTGKKPSKRLIQRRLKTEKLDMPGVYANPKVRTKIKAESQRERFDPDIGPTKEASARLIKRRKLNAKMVPAGFFANPSARQNVLPMMHYCVAGNDAYLAAFPYKAAADEYCALLKKAHPSRDFYVFPLD